MSDDDENCVCVFLPHEDVSINGFMFCASHGRECCHVCCTDHRATNNMQASHFSQTTAPSHDLLAVLTAGARPQSGWKQQQRQRQQQHALDTCTLAAVILRRGGLLLLQLGMLLQSQRTNR
ncbi:hypothetical protein COO60DRAFT_452030 [Scenedesmus sp. NREL 46B-D3]|nr:hypothetical protein COO60DRAFT_452030 [Scenedesmus sp. NREL 46B-D3]